MLRSGKVGIWSASKWFESKALGVLFFSSLANIVMGNSLSMDGSGMEGRDVEEKLSNKHVVLSSQLRPPYPKEGLDSIVVATGCYWGAEKGFWRLPGVYTTAVGYAGGTTKNPTYHETCTGRTGHTEAVLVVWDSTKLGTADILKQFWECHDPTQVNGQGFDTGTQYRSALYWTTEAQKDLAFASKEAYSKALGNRKIATEMKSLQEAGPFYYAHEEYQQYLARPGARQYCSAQPQGVALPPFDTWAPDEYKGSDKHGNKLPEDFWTKYGSAANPHCTMKSPHEQIVWSNM
mmetsp:Transcript_29551/g.82596  ORF Transcript_29551/g.82596 Transcript_29551/m.82596 type:complete len:291 (-) Transcript_29551:55-927(-)